MEIVLKTEYFAITIRFCDKLPNLRKKNLFDTYLNCCSAPEKVTGHGQDL